LLDVINFFFDFEKEKTICKELIGASIQANKYLFIDEKKSADFNQKIKDYQLKWFWERLVFRGIFYLRVSKESKLEREKKWRILTLQHSTKQI